MKPYVMTTGTLFGLLTLVHIWRMVVEPQHASDPWYLGITAIAAAFCLWAWRLVRLSTRA